MLFVHGWVSTHPLVVHGCPHTSPGAIPTKKCVHVYIYIYVNEYSYSTIRTYLRMYARIYLYVANTSYIIYRVYRRNDFMLMPSLPHGCSSRPKVGRPW